MAPTKAEQDQEARARLAAQSGNGIDTDDARANERDAAAGSDPTGDDIDAGDGGEPRQTRQQQEDDRPARPERSMSPGDKLRMEMASRVRRQEEQPFSGDINDPEVIFGESARQQLEPEPSDGDDEIIGSAADGGQQQQQQPRKIKLRVNGQEVELDEDEVIRRAQKVTAADSYLDEAKTLLKEAKQIKRSRGAADDDDQDQIGDERHDHELDDRQQTRRDQNPDQRLQEAVEKIQFGDREEAAKVLGEVIDEVADRKTDERQLKRLINNDFAKAQQSLKAFTEANKDLANDEVFAAGMEATMYRLYREEIELLGAVEPDKIPTDKQALANWHRWYRVHGANVSSTDQLLTKAKDTVLARFKQPASREQRTDPPRAQSRVHVNVDRTERRASIPNNPSRSAAPRSNEQTRSSANQQTSRSAVVSEMRRARGQATA